MINGIKPVFCEVRVDDKFLLVPRTARLELKESKLEVITIEEKASFDFQSKDAAVKGLIIIANLLRDTTKQGVIVTSDGEKVLDYTCGW